MRINEILTESQTQELEEGPFGQAIGKAVGGVAKGAGAVAGGIAGIPKAFKKGFAAGKQAVAGDDEEPAAQPKAAQTSKTVAAKTTATKPAQQTSPANTQDPKLNLPSAGKTGFLKAMDKLSGRDDFTSDIEKQKANAVKTAKADLKAAAKTQPTAQPKTSAAPAADTTATPAVKPQAQPTNTAYSQAQQAVSKLQSPQLKTILKLLNNDLKVKAKLAQSASAPKVAKPVAKKPAVV